MIVGTKTKSREPQPSEETVAFTCACGAKTELVVAEPHPPCGACGKPVPDLAKLTGLFDSLFTTTGGGRGSAEPIAFGEPRNENTPRPTRSDDSTVVAQPYREVPRSETSPFFHAFAAPDFAGGATVGKRSFLRASSTWALSLGSVLAIASGVATALILRNELVGGEPIAHRGAVMIPILITCYFTAISAAGLRRRWPNELRSRWLRVPAIITWVALQLCAVVWVASTLL